MHSSPIVGTTGEEMWLKGQPIIHVAFQGYENQKLYTE